MRPYWDNLSMFLYVVMGIVSMISLNNALKYREICKSKSLLHLSYGIIVWTIFSSFRVVDYGIGGADALSYIGYFENCISGLKVYPYSDHMDWLMGVIIKAIRYCTKSHYVFFMIVYGFMAWSYFFFCYKYAPKKSSCVSYFLLFYLYLRSFCTLRSNFCISFILLGLVSLLYLKKIRCI